MSRYNDPSLERCNFEEKGYLWAPKKTFDTPLLAVEKFIRKGKKKK